MNGGQRNARGFTIRESLLIADYLRTMGANATESAKRAGYSGNRNTLGVTAFETLRRPKIAREIRRRMTKKLSTDQIESEIAEVALADVAIDAPAKMKALDLLTKINGMITQKIETVQPDIADTFLARIKSAAQKSQISEPQAAIKLFDSLLEWGSEHADPANFGPFQEIVAAHAKSLQGQQAEQITEIGDQ